MLKTSNATVFQYYSFYAYAPAFLGGVKVAAIDPAEHPGADVAEPSR